MSLRILFAGTPDFALPTLAALVESDHEILAVYTQPDRPAGRGRTLQASPIKTYALSRGLAVQQPDSLKRDTEQALLATFAADLMVVIAYGLILPGAVLNTPRLGCVNLHASLLPRWRGAAPIQRAILAGDRETGVTLMQMDVGLDTGAMLGTRMITIGEDETSESLHAKLAELAADTLLENLNAIATGTLKPRAQNEATACYAEKLNKSEAPINWNHSAEQICRQVQAFNPWPVAETGYQGNPLRIWRACALSNTLSDCSGRPPGTVITVDVDGITVACGVGVLRLTEVQAAGRRRMSATDFSRGHALVAGDKFS